LKERVAGSDLVPQLAKLSAQRGYRIYLLGAAEESSAGVAAWMRRSYPDIQIVGRYCPKHQPLEEMDHEEILARIESAKPDILLVAFGNPKQEKWLAMHRHKLKVPVCIGVGGTFDFLSGRTFRAPMWMQRSGMEWLHRMIQEPSRLAERYVGNALGLLRYLPVQLAALAMQGKRRHSAEIAKEVIDSTTILHVNGDFTGSMLLQFQAEVHRAVLSGSHVVLDMNRTDYIGADALASLIYVMNIARCWKRELWLTGLNGPLTHVLGASRLRSFFRTAPKVSEALRRIQPEQMPISQIGKEWEVCRIGGQLIPIHVEEVPAVYRQVQQLLGRRIEAGSVRNLSSHGFGINSLTSELIPADVG
jgi:N-acetylglucosaminyldiphosphoundecaprenol N-acetyl-beta-D-mannosaminyltransferase